MSPQGTWEFCPWESSLLALLAETTICALWLLNALIHPEIFCRKENCFLERSLSDARSWLSETSGSGNSCGRGSAKWVTIKGWRICFKVLSCGFDSWKVSFVCDDQDINAKIGFRAQLHYIWEYFPQQELFAWDFGDTVVSESLSIFWSCHLKKFPCHLKK